mmetsp:Transcript_26093/g.46262  ORF Transcript_26093/g.46262 Transcript_26093/m.46262 type:complete len:217 (+) Transcript_26093:151-801(+)
MQNCVTCILWKVHSSMHGTIMITTVRHVRVERRMEKEARKVKREVKRVRAARTSTRTRTAATAIITTNPSPNLNAPCLPGSIRTCNLESSLARATRTADSPLADPMRARKDAETSRWGCVVRFDSTTEEQSRIAVLKMCSTATATEPILFHRVIVVATPIRSGSPIGPSIPTWVVINGLRTMDTDAHHSMPTITNSASIVIVPTVLTLPVTRKFQD